ncbi:heterokaryon incompatibility protein-domain-containing protein [Aspergillus taichungensis]|uniref:Heterokaryon incompatibility protein-domain-containing protein n=1 Tax=Aspergillus taichungensis TaxID=482145 RepID=A0A2J5HRK7_9EURO|nr:heterokaryon incompatibility protein-domain-containing protein [Aspergillus taichungensis]
MSLPQGWEAHETLEGRIIFHHSESDLVTWDPPVSDFEKALYDPTELEDSPLSPFFEALSYVWGWPDMADEVIIVSKSNHDEIEGIVRITANLDAALRHLRFEDRPRTLWIDAICIDQGDLNERSEQVQRMAQIYTQSQRVVVWLGEASPDSKLALDSLCHLGRQNVITKSNFGFRAPGAEYPDWWLPSYDIPFDDETWKAICSILDRAWFQRLWVFQEIQLASPRAVLQCGHDEGSWADVRASILCLKEKNQTFLSELVANLRKHFMLYLDWRGESFPLMMNSVRRRLCSDERDLIYALLGLMTPTFASLVRPNYRLPAREVYKDVFLAHVKATQRLELISYCGRGAELGSPTWVPNWVIRDQYDPNRGLASGISPAVISTPTLDILEVSGVSCGIISHAGGLAQGEADERVQMARTWYREGTSWIEESGFRGNSNVPFRDAFASMLLEGGVGDVYPEIISVTCRGWSKKWVAMCEEDRKLSADDVMADPELFRCAQLITWSRFVTTAEGYIGLAPRATQPGDIIAVLLGSNTPVVLRPKGDRRFSVIGSCYVHGLMHGEGDQNCQELELLPSAEQGIENPILVIPTSPDEEAAGDTSLALPTIHEGVFCDGPSCGNGPDPQPIQGARYKCATCPDVDFCVDCLLDDANPHSKTHPLLKCTTPSALPSYRKRLEASRLKTKPTKGGPIARRHELHSIRYEGIQNHVTQTIISDVMGRKSDEIIHDPAVRQMVDDLSQVMSRRGKESTNALDAPKAERPDKDPLSEEVMDRIAVSFVTEDSPRSGKEDKSLAAADEEKKWSQYKHHQFIRRWGLFSEDDGRDEEWWIEDPEIFDEQDPRYLCEMCRHIDFKTLFTQRDLPGNTVPGETVITLYGLSHVMAGDCACGFCRLLRQSFVENGLPTDDGPQIFEGQEIVLKVLDEGPEYGLRLEISVPFTVAHAEYEPMPPMLIQWADGENEQHPGGRVIRQKSTDFTLLKSWIDTCDRCHSVSDNQSPTDAHEDTLELRFIDVHRNCIVTPTRLPRYACLSYVWGGITGTQYTSDTKADMEEENGLYHASVPLPLTIRDAMKVTKDIGIDYLWVDALCILQDSQEDISRNVAGAGLIYSGAAVTIVASSNSDSTHGLPGAGTVPRSKGQIRETVQGMCLAKVFHNPRGQLEDIEKSVWNTRAWTYQERQLSHRIVCFTESEMVFMCPHATCFEDTVPAMNLHWKPAPNGDLFNAEPRGIEFHIWSDPTQRQFPNKAFETSGGSVAMVAVDPDKQNEGAPCSDPAPLYRISRLSGPHLPGRLEDHAEDVTPWKRYTNAVSQYTKRMLSFDDDAVRAFAGMRGLIARGANTKFWYGMPEFAFDRALLWYPKQPVERRKQGEHSLFPSWTWAAWKGRIRYRGKGWHNSQYHGPLSVIQWYQNLTRQDFLARYPTDSNSGRPMEETIDGLELDTFLSPLDPDKINKVSDPLDGWVPQFDEASNQHYYTHEAYPGLPFDYPVYLPGQEVPERPDPEGILYFNARTARIQLYDINAAGQSRGQFGNEFIQIGLHDESRSANYRPAWKRILYHQGYRCGFLVLNIPFEEIENASADENYYLAAISRDSLPEIPMSGKKGLAYRALDPRQAQYFIYKESQEEDPLTSYDAPDPTARRDILPKSENGDPHWDEGRFETCMVFPIYNVLLLRGNGKYSERVGVGKIHFHAFHLASRKTSLIMLK